MSASISPLQAINQKELELRHRVEQAHTRAKTQILAAKEEAKQIIAQADREGRAEAETFYQRGIEEARREAEVMVAAAHKEAAVLQQRAEAKRDEAARQIVELVLPVSISPSKKAKLLNSNAVLR
jgi:vacuolar-type H+-ATPase subunit H